VRLHRICPPPGPESVGLSSERLGRIGTTVQRSIDRKRIAGAVTLVARNCQVVWFEAQGMAVHEAGKPMRADTMFRICSHDEAGHKCCCDDDC
jgi:CubicO group peptidase (beta-lactamase class C family)